eukprot:COSAG03_NODE_368_length_8526_cov_6.102053_3_plen_86_part_00
MKFNPGECVCLRVCVSLPPVCGGVGGGSGRGLHLKIRAMFECVAVRIARANNKCRNVASDTGMAQGTMPKFQVGTHCIGLIYAVW